MTGRPTSGAASPTAPASKPPEGLDGLNPATSRIVRVPSTPLDADAPGAADGAVHEWHVLDNGPRLEALGVRPVGTLLCVHGNPTWSYLWRRLVASATDAAAAGRDAWRVVAVDQLEMGFSTRTGAVRPLARRVRDLADLTDALALDGPVVTVGHDWGGVISLGWAVDHPELLAGTVLLNTAVHHPWDERPIPAPLRAALHPALHRPATVTTPAFLRTALALAHRPLGAAVREAYHAPYRGADRREGIGAFVADIPVDAAHPSRAELDRVADGVRGLRVPALMLWGPRDPVFGDRYLDDLVDRLPHADVHRFEGAGHLVAEDADYAGAVLTWLGDRLGGRTGDPVDGRTPDDAAAAAPRPPLWHRLDELADGPDPDATALVEMAPPSGPAPRVVRWRLLGRRVREVAAGLHRTGVRPGDRVSLLVPPGADLTALLYACLRIGAVVVVADAGLGIRGLTRAVRGAWPDHVVGALPGLTAARTLGWPGRRISTAPLPTAVARALAVEHSLLDLADIGAEHLAAGGRLPPEPAPTDPAAILFTSGSTGPAKGVVYTHDQLSAVRDALATQYDIGPGTGLVAGFAPFALLGPALGTRSVTPDMDVTAPRTLTASAVAAAVAAADATVLFLSPAAITNVVATADGLTDADHAALARVRTFLSAGAPVPERLLAAAGRLLPNATPHTPYGMTEGLLLTDITLDEVRAAGSGAGAQEPGDQTAGDQGAGGPRGAGGRGVAKEQAPVDAGGVCVGRPHPSARVLVDPLDADGVPVGSPGTAAGVTGEIVALAPHVKDHYDRLWLTDRTSRLGLPEERGHRTGDVGHLDAEGRLWVEGRLAHVVVTADGVVTPVGPEQRVEAVPEVARAAVVGVGPRGTQQLVAVVETVPPARRPGLAAAPLADAVRDAAGARWPLAAVLVVPDLPTDVRHNSKIDRSALARWASDVLAGGRMRRP